LIILKQPFEDLFDCVRSVNQFLERLVMWPRDTGRAIWRCSSTCPNPFWTFSLQRTLI